MGSFRTVLENELIELGLNKWKQFLEEVYFFDEEELENQGLIFLDKRFEHLPNKDLKELLKGMNTYDGIIEKEYVYEGKKFFDSYELQRITLETKGLPRGDFKGRVAFLDYFDVATNLKEDSLKYHIEAFRNGKRNLESDGSLNLYIFSTGSYYVFTSGGNHRTYTAMLFAPLVKSFSVSNFTKIYVRKGKYFDKALSILESYYYVKELYKRLGLDIKIEAFTYHFNVTMYSDDSESCIFVNVNTTSFDDLVKILEENRLKFIWLFKRLTTSEKIEKNVLGKIISFFIKPVSGRDYRYNYKWSIKEKKFFVKN